MGSACRARGLLAVGAFAVSAWAPASGSADDDGVVLEIAAGTAFSVPLPLTLQQEGFPELRHRAHYETRPFLGAPYYAWRIGLWRRGGGWELQLVHHKLYLVDPPPEIAWFEVTHGYNLLTAGRAWRRGRALVRAGGGVVLAHPESTVRGLTWPENGGLAPAFLGLLGGNGYFLTGPTLRVSAGRAFGHRLFVAPEIELTAARARVPVAGGEASVPNIAVHLRLALGGRL